MAKFSKFEVLQKLHTTRLVPLFYEPNTDRAIAIVKACYDGGARLLEFTNRGDFAHEVFAEMVKYSRKNLPELAIGVGSVQDAATTALFLQCGADFIVSPCFQQDIAIVCNRRSIPYLPGCATLTEMSRALEAGVDVVKLFPGEIMGPTFVKGALAPMPWLQIMPTGGVEPTEESLKSWLDAGVVAVGMGSKLIGKESLPHDITQKVAFCLNSIQQIKGL
jgi:2-dehydro-3-deoxyphosphogluconate aldolase/(4S)-4-hydroxy-2-oxoglutarate aldolase